MMGEIIVKKHSRLLLCLVGIVLIIWLLWGNLTVGITNVSVEVNDLPSTLEGLRIAHVSDLHNTVLWQQAIDRLKRIKPDLICITGDIVDSSHTNVDRALAFAAEAVKIAPCYYVTGNHELILSRADQEKLLRGLESLGITVLQKDAVILELDEAQLCVAGVGWGIPASVAKPQDFDGYTLLLAHAPEEFESYVSAGFDLVLSGHAHGGQFRLPFVGGLVAPGQGFFPHYDSGLYRSGDTAMVVSRGVGNSIIPVRINNRPEVICVVLTAGGSS